jgi:hypothetical protein
MFRKEKRLRDINWLVFVMEKQYDTFKVWTKPLTILTLISGFKGLTDFALRVGQGSGAGRYELSQLQYVRVSDLRRLRMTWY